MFRLLCQCYNRKKIGVCMLLMLFGNEASFIEGAIFFRFSVAKEILRLTINIYKKFFVLSSFHIDIAVVTFDLFSIYEILNFLHRFCPTFISTTTFYSSFHFLFVILLLLLLRHFPFSLILCLWAGWYARQELRTLISVCMYILYTHTIHVSIYTI